MHSYLEVCSREVASDQLWGFALRFARYGVFPVVVPTQVLDRISYNAEWADLSGNGSFSSTRYLLQYSFYQLLAKRGATPDARHPKDQTREFMSGLLESSGTVASLVTDILRLCI